MAQLLTLRLARTDSAQSWGFRLQGGKDFGTPLLIQKVNAGSIAERAGLRVGDALIRVNNVEVDDLRHKDAQDVIIKAGNAFEVSIQRGGHVTWKPSVSPVGSIPSPNPYISVSPVPVTKTSLAATYKPGNRPPHGFNVASKPFSPQLNGGCGHDGENGAIKAIVNKQYNSPVGIYSDESIAETLSAQAEVLAGGVLGVNFKKNEKNYNSEGSEVLKMLREAESETKWPESAEEPRADNHHEPSVPGLRSVSAPRPKSPSADSQSLAPGKNICADCERLIVGVFVRIKGKNLHVECFKCATCGTSLKNVGYYSINEKLYCDIHAKMVARQNPPAPNLEPVTEPPQSRPSDRTPWKTSPSPSRFSTPSSIATQNRFTSPSPHLISTNGDTSNTHNQHFGNGSFSTSSTSSNSVDTFKTARSVMEQTTSSNCVRRVYATNVSAATTTLYPAQQRLPFLRPRDDGPKPQEPKVSQNVASKVSAIVRTTVADNIRVSSEDITRQVATLSASTGSPFSGQTPVAQLPIHTVENRQVNKDPEKWKTAPADRETTPLAQLIPGQAPVAQLPIHTVENRQVNKDPGKEKTASADRETIPLAQLLMPEQAPVAQLPIPTVENRQVNKDPEKEKTAPAARETIPLAQLLMQSTRDRVNKGGQTAPTNSAVTREPPAQLPQQHVDSDIEDRAKLQSACSREIARIMSDFDGGESSDDLDGEEASAQKYECEEAQYDWRSSFMEKRSIDIGTPHGVRPLSPCQPVPRPDQVVVFPPPAPSYYPQSGASASPSLSQSSYEALETCAIRSKHSAESRNRYDESSNTRPVSNTSVTSDHGGIAQFENAPDSSPQNDSRCEDTAPIDSRTSTPASLTDAPLRGGTFATALTIAPERPYTPLQSSAATIFAESPNLPEVSECYIPKVEDTCAVTLDELRRPRLSDALTTIGCATAESDGALPSLEDDPSAILLRPSSVVERRDEKKADEGRLSRSSLRRELEIKMDEKRAVWRAERRPRDGGSAQSSRLASPVPPYRRPTPTNFEATVSTCSKVFGAETKASTTRCATLTCTRTRRSRSRSPVPSLQGSSQGFQEHTESTTTVVVASVCEQTTAPTAQSPVSADHHRQRQHEQQPEPRQQQHQQQRNQPSPRAATEARLAHPPSPRPSPKQPRRRLSAVAEERGAHGAGGGERTASRAAAASLLAARLGSLAGANCATANVCASASPACASTPAPTGAGHRASKTTFVADHSGGGGGSAKAPGGAFPSATAASPSSAGLSAPRRGRGVWNPQSAAPGARIPLCARCNSQIRGPFVTALGKIWCPEHFICVNDKCGQSLLDIGFVEEPTGLYCEYCFERYLAPTCNKCSSKIKADCLNAIGKHFHPNCFTCAYCGRLFGNDPFFLEDGSPYCENDWNELFTTKCFACGFPIEAGDRWVEALENNYHSPCFNCTIEHTMQVNSSHKHKQSSPTATASKSSTNRVKRKSRWKLKFHHQALPPEYLDHYEASLQQEAKPKTPPAATPPVATTIQPSSTTPSSTIHAKVPSATALRPAPAKLAPSSCTTPAPTAPQPAPPAASLQSTVRYKDLPYMGEMTLDNARPRRGRKPKKADICHLIYKNYGTTVVDEPLNLCLRDLQNMAVDGSAASGGRGNDISLHKFKFVGGATPSLQERRSASTLGGLASGASRPPEKKGRLRSQELKRKSRKSLAREKLEKTFEERGFLIQTQQLESAQGATYCKFRQLRKFTRYLFRSWKHHLPGDVVNNEA